MVRPQHRPLQAVKTGRAVPGYSAPPVAESTRTHSVWDGYLDRPRRATGREVSLAQTLLKGKVKTESRDSVISSWEWNLVLHCGKCEGIKLGKGKRWTQAPHAGAPQRPPSLVAAKLTPEKDPDSTVRVRNNTESPKQILEAQWFPS